MRMRDILRDRLPAVLITFGAWLLITAFMVAFHTGSALIVTFSCVYFISALCRFLWDILRRKRFYDDLAEGSRQLDRKYLISEVIEEPDFLEGRLTCEALREAGRSMYEDVAALSRENAAFREFIEMWVHEIKLPVAALQLMCHNDDNARYAEQLRRIDDYIETVLYYARSGSDGKDYIIKETPLDRVFADTAVRHRAELQLRDVEIRTEGLGTTVMSDSKWLGYILGQLMGNSLKYLSPDREPEICVRAEVLPDRTLLHFRDNGVGIPAGDLPYIFDKSFTGENGRTYSGATGMGLYIVKKLCGRLGHGISADSVPGEYTEITLSFGNNDLFRPDVTKS
ncbi:MAG: sensor histidine kinase [Ruminococcus sp.]|nr:sensor histidine kinase [Ruminococcus sp.]